MKPAYYCLQVRLYDISAQRRPVISIDFREAPIRAVAEDLDGWTVYVGNGSGDLASFDMRTGMTYDSMYNCSWITCLFIFIFKVQLAN